MRKKFLGIMYYFHFQINWYNLLQKYAEGSEVVMKNAHPLNIDINYLIDLAISQ